MRHLVAPGETRGAPVLQNEALLPLRWPCLIVRTKQAVDSASISKGDMPLVLRARGPMTSRHGHHRITGNLGSHRWYV